ncbi:MAG: hypothetical protein LBR98_00860 [Syntrophomonadaceae bacterium]|jgi:AraC-like DNA-binding protein|nr:hypothetical protein [Syntrophomonadaceae bacterium]
MKPPYTGIGQCDKNAAPITIDGNDHIVQAEDIFFIKSEKSKRCRYFRGNGELAQGYIKQLFFHNVLFLEQVNCRYCSPVSIWYQTPFPFIKIIYSESGKALYQDVLPNEYSVGRGVYICKNRGIEANLAFSANMPIQGIRIFVFDKFYNHYLKQRFPDDNLNLDTLPQFDNTNYADPDLQIVFNQIKQGMKLGIESELYYESKVAEILFLISKNYVFSAKRNKIHILKQHDFLAVNEAKRIIDASIANSPKISDISSFVHVSPAKLQIDFQTAFGCTIHGYVQ